MKKNTLKLYLAKFSIVVALILIGLFFRTYQSTQSSLWTDEFATNWVAQASTVKEVIHRAALTQGQSPFYFIVIHYIIKHFRASEFTLRVLSLISSLISIYLIFEIGLLIFNRERFSFLLSRFLSTSTEFNDKDNFTVAFLSAMFAALLFAVDPLRIYYAQEARPYAFATMFALFSTLFFLKMFGNRSVLNILFYILSSALVCYAHYVFGTILLLHNLWVVFVLLLSYYMNKTIENKKIQLNRLVSWILIQIAIIVLLIPLLFHMIPIIKNSSKWTWLVSGGLIDTFSVLFKMFDFRAFIIFAAVYALLFLYDFSHNYHTKRKSMFFKQFIPFGFVFFWFIIPPLFAYAVGKLLNTSMLDIRYMTLSGLAFYFFAALCLSFINDKFVKLFLISFIISTYIAISLFPLYKKYHRFSHRISHNWRAAIETINKNIKPSDCIILRSGFVKENWIPYTKDVTIIDYVRAPLKSFYFLPDFFPKGVRVDDPSEFFDIYNMTYTYESDFGPYYEKILAKSALHHRIWILGVNPPNTNYPINQAPELLCDSHKKVFEKSFSGVYLTLIIRAGKNK